MNPKWLLAMLLCSASALAQESPLSISVGARAWYTDWSTFSYYAVEDVDVTLTQDNASPTLVVIPLVNARYEKLIASASGYASTRFDLPDGRSGTREEFDINVGYFVMESVVVTLGYKKMSQSDGPDRYRPSGPVIGVSASAPLGETLSLYGNLGVGWLKTSGGDDIEFEADYRLMEVGAAYSLDGGRLPKRWTFTAGYRMQVMTSKDAFRTPEGSRLDGRDTTQGFTIGALATF